MATMPHNLGRLMNSNMANTLTHLTSDLRYPLAILIAPPVGAVGALPFCGWLGAERIPDQISIARL